MVLLTDWGQMPELPKGAVWRRYLHNFASASKYRSVVDHYLAFHEVQGNCSEETLSENVGNYFEHERSFHKRKSSTLRSRFSALKKFFLHTARRDIAKEQTLVESNFAKWDKVDTTKQSAVFLKEHYVALLALPRTKDTVLYKAVAMVGNCFAARGGELMTLKWGDVKRCVDATTHEVTFQIAYHRLKKSTSNSTDVEWALLNCKEGVKAVDDYIGCFPPMTSPANLARNFWLRLNQSGVKVKATSNAANIGRNIMSKIGCSIAVLLELENPAKYTGHEHPHEGHRSECNLPLQRPERARWTCSRDCWLDGPSRCLSSEQASLRAHNPGHPRSSLQHHHQRDGRCQRQLGLVPEGLSKLEQIKYAALTYSRLYIPQLVYCM